MDLRLILIPTTKYVVGIFCGRTIIKLGFPIVQNSKVWHFSYPANFFVDFATKSRTFFLLSISNSMNEN